MNETLRLQLSGAPQLLRGDAPPLPLQPLDAALLAWLALEGATDREQLALLLWPESDPAAARNALRQRLFRLRRQAGRDLIAGSASLALADGVVHDLHGAQTLLGTLRLPGHGELDAWLERRRDAAAALARARLEARVDALERSGDTAAALPLALQLLQQQPHSEDAHRRVMRLHYLRGDRAAALLAFDHCEAVLKREVGARPSPQTLALLQLIDAAGEAGAAPPPPAGQMPVSLLRPPQLVGRDPELAALRAARSAGGLALVIGEAGIGKSRLLQALAGPGCVTVAARPGDALVPCATLARLLAALLEQHPAVFDEPLRRSLAPLLPALAPSAAGRPRRAALDAPLAQLLQRLSGSVDLLVLDDLHFADTASVELLQAVLAAPRDAPRGPPWCIGLRPPAAGSAQQRLLAALASALPCTTLPLRPLPPAAVAQLVDSLRLEGASGERLAPALCRTAGGNPLFVLESLKLAWGQGRLGDDPASLPAPPSLARLIEQQLERLSPPALALARLAAVAGSDFTLPLAEAVLGRDALALADAWHELEAAQVLVGDAFAHDLIHEAVLAGVPALIARHLHARLAERLQDSGGEPARIAAHWEAAGQRERALPGLLAAADRAHAALREAEHVDFLLRAADIAEAGGQRDTAFDCVAAAIDSHMNTIRQASGYPLLDRLDRLAASPVQQASAWGRRAWYAAQLADHGTAIAYGERALALAATLNEPRLLAMVRQRLAASLGAAGKLDAALEQMQFALPVLASSPHAEERAEFHGNVAVLFDNVGLFDDAARHRQQAIDATQELGDHAHAVGLWANHAASRLRLGDTAQAAAAVAQAQQLIGSYELRGSTVGFVAVLAQQVARAEGRWRDAAAAAARARRELEASNPARLPVVLLHEGHAWIDLGQPARAWQALQACADGLPAHGQVRCRLLLARLARQLGQDPAVHLAAARQAAPAQGWPEVTLLLAIETAAQRHDAAALKTLQHEAQQQGLHGTAVEAWLQRDDDEAADPGAVLGMLALARRHAAPLAYRGAVWLHAARLLRNAGDDAAAQRVLDEGRRWVEQAAATQLLPEWRDAFLRRNPVNAALLGI